MAIERTRNNIIEQALQKIGVISPDEQPRAGDVQSCAVQLDYMVKSWQGTGPHLWSLREGILFLQPGQQQYRLGTDSTDRCAASELDVVNTLTNADLVTGATQIDVVSEDGIAVNDYLGVLLNNGSLHWSTVASLSPLTINDALPSDADSGRVVWAYTDQVGKILRIPASRRNQGQVTGIDGQDVSMTDLGREDYYNLPEKDTRGTPTQYYYQPGIDDGQLRIWPTAQDSTIFLKFTYLRPIDVFDNSASAPDFPNEWLNALVYNLALEMMPNYGIDPNTVPSIPEAANRYLNMALNFDTGTGDIIFQYAFGLGE